MFRRRRTSIRQAPFRALRGVSFAMGLGFILLTTNTTETVKDAVAILAVAMAAIQSEPGEHTIHESEQK